MDGALTSGLAHDLAEEEVPPSIETEAESIFGLSQLRSRAMRVGLVVVLLVVVTSIIIHVDKVVSNERCGSPLAHSSTLEKHDRQIAGQHSTECARDNGPTGF